MATPTLSLKVKSDGSFAVENPAAQSLSSYRHKDDKELWGTEWNKKRSCAPCPAVHPLLPNSDHKVEMTEQWQYYIRAINWGMTAWYVSGLFGAQKAFTNRRADDVRANWLLRKDLTRPNPDQDRVRSCSRAPISVGTITGDFCSIKMMTGTKPPLLKDGYNYPSRVSDIDPDAYFYHPRTHPEMFLVATITSGTGRTRPFPNGAVYNWKDSSPYVFWPYVSNRPITYTLDNLVEVTGITNPYT